MGKTYGNVEEHITLLVQILETTGVVGESVAGVCSGCVSQENALDLAGELCCHGRIISHDVAVASVGDEDEFPVGIGAEDFLEQVFADAEGLIDIAEVEGTGVEGTAGVGLVDEVHIIARDLLGGGG